MKFLILLFPVLAMAQTESRSERLAEFRAAHPRLSREQVADAVRIIMNVEVSWVFEAPVVMATAQPNAPVSDLVAEVQTVHPEMSAIEIGELVFALGH